MSFKRGGSRPPRGLPPFPHSLRLFAGRPIGTKQEDQISDFTQGLDRVDLSEIDANGNFEDGDQAFTFLADPANHAGDWTGLVWSETDARGITTVFASNDADADAEMNIYMAHGYTFNAGDFIL